MSVTRRRLLGAALLAPTAVAATRAVETLLTAVDAATRAARPRPLGTTATRCATCGGIDHTMLDPVCPNGPKVL